MTALQISQLPVEVLQAPSAPKLQTSQVLADVLQRPTTPKLQFSQIAVEVLMSNAKYTQAWLLDPAAIRIVLIEVGVCVGGVETTRYLSSGSYVTSPLALPANMPYLPVVMGGLVITESLPVDGDASLSVGDIAIDNAGGLRDGWLGDVWVNRPCKAWIGDPRWERSDFHLIFSGINADIGSSDRSTLNLTLSNKLQRLNTAITDIKLGGDCVYTQNGTAVTVTKINHGRRITSPIEVHVGSGAATSGSYAVMATPTADTFTYIAGTSATTAGMLTLGGLNADATIPLALGESHNITPLLTDEVSLEYQCHGGAMQSISEVRDNGKPIPVTTHNNSGKFELLEPPVGAITVSVQGDSPAGGYGRTVAQLVRRIVTGYGVASNRFTDADLDLSSLAAFDAAHPQPVGMFVIDRSNVLTVCQQLAASIGAQMAMSRAGLLRLVQINFPPAGIAVEIPRSAQIDRTLHIVARSNVAASVKLGYAKNWTVQPGLLTTIPAAHKDSFATEWWSVTSTDAAVQAAYKLGAEPVQQDTLLLTRADAQAEADRRLARDKVVRTTYQFEGTATQLELQLGQAVTLFSSRFGLSGGALGIVTSLAPNWQTGHVVVEVTI